MNLLRESGQHATGVQSFYNAVPNVFWSVLGLLPIGIFSYKWVDRLWLWTFVGISLLPCVLPVSLLKRLELSSKPAAYRNLGVHWANRLVQHGTWINRLIQKSAPQYRRISSRVDASTLIRSTYYQERFHWAMFLWFLFTTAYAMIRGYAGWALLITVTNVVYNLYPIWLQQYIRLRMKRSLHRHRTQVS